MCQILCFTAFHHIAGEHMVPLAARYREGAQKGRQSIIFQIQKSFWLKTFVCLIMNDTIKNEHFEHFDWNETISVTQRRAIITLGSCECWTEWMGWNTVHHLWPKIPPSPPLTVEWNGGQRQGLAALCGPESAAEMAAAQVLDVGKWKGLLAERLQMNRQSTFQGLENTHME